MSLKLQQGNQEDKLGGFEKSEVLDQIAWGRGGGSAVGDWTRTCQEQFRSS